MNTSKFNKEIQNLKALPEEPFLHPLKKEQIKQVLMERISTETSSGTQRFTWQERKHKLMRYLISVLVGLSLVGGTAFASNNAKPGDALFPIKKAKEQIQLTLTTSDQAKAELQAKFAQERLKELKDIEIHMSASASATATSTLETEAHKAAKAEVRNAVTTLEGVKTKLEAKGNTAAATAIGETIVRLQDEEQIQTHTKAQSENGDNNKNSHKDEDNNHSNNEVHSQTQVQINGSAHKDTENDSIIELKGKSEDHIKVK